MKAGTLIRIEYNTLWSSGDICSRENCIRIMDSEAASLVWAGPADELEGVRFFRLLLLTRSGPGWVFQMMPGGVKPLVTDTTDP